MSRLAYFVRETLISLRRNLLMTLAGIITVAVSLALFGGIRLVQRVVDHGTSKWKDGVELEIFMEVDAGEAQIADVRAQLEADEDVRSFEFLTKEDAYEEFKRIFRDQPALIESTTPDALPTSFRVAPTEAELTEQVKRRFESVPGVDEVITPEEQIEKILDITRWINFVFTAMAVVLLASSIFLIVNTIRLATFARRREIEVMKLVGASNWFVRIPFMAEGFVQGAIGAGFAFGLIFALKIVIADFVAGAQRLWGGFYVTNADAISVGVLVLVIGAGVGVLGSVIGLRRFLDA
ncbi:MAG: cell division protein FtsX [Acidimicrobiia bacterium]|nr:MAG: cell division protein FtsX [Acidimicrobiia bacterium]